MDKHDYTEKGESEKSFLLGNIDNPSTESKHPKWRIAITWIVIILLAMFMIDKNIWTHSTEISKETNHVGPNSPHIVMFLVDDQGFNDIGYQSSDLNEMTPNIDALANDGIKLSWYYTAAVCTPSRASMMTGLYTIHLGMQHYIVSGTHKFGLPLDVNPMPQIMRAAGYNTAMFGKWHLGHYTDRHIPTSRGFDKFFGFYSGFQDYFTHVSESMICTDPNCFFDLRDGLGYLDTSSLSDNEAYGPHLFQQSALGFIEQYDTNTPLFLYYAEALVHEPTEAPDYIFTEYATLLDSVPNQERRIFAAMTIYLDQVVKNLTSALKDKGMWENTVFIYSSDNGGDPTALGSGSNLPLRGRKLNLFEGGVRVPAFVHSELLPNNIKGSTYSYMFHIADWLPTIVLGILDRRDILDELSTAQATLDGVNQWTQMLEGSEISTLPSYPSNAPRSEILLGIDYLNFEHEWVGYDTSAIIVGYYKLITNEVNETWWYLPGEEFNAREPLFLVPGTPVYTYLFNLQDDPEEKVDLSLVYPEIVEELTLTLASHRTTMIESLFCSVEDEAGFAYQKITGFISPWTDTTDTCELRVLGDGSEELNYNPSYLSGSS